MKACVAGLRALIASSSFVVRRILLAAVTCFANRRFAFTIAVVSLLAAKDVHLFAHRDALPTSDVLLWGSSFYIQDTILSLALYGLMQDSVFVLGGVVGILARVLALLIIGFSLSLAAFSISFYATTGDEIQWRNITLAGDSSSWSTLVTGLLSCAFVMAGILLVALALQNPCYASAGIACDIVGWPFRFVKRKMGWARPASSNTEVKYEHLAGDDVPGSVSEDYPSDSGSSCGETDTRASSRFMQLSYILVGLSMATQVLCLIFRPVDSSFSYMTWTLPLVPFLDFATLASSASPLAGLLGFSSWSDTLGKHTALRKPIDLPWLPTDVKLQGFEDWSDGKEHYDASADPLKITNLDDDLLPELAGKLKGLSIRHVMLVKLESTRKDVFPFKKENAIWDKLINTYENKTFPDAAYERMETLTPTARYITGDHDDGFSHSGDGDAKPKSRGGINAKNAYTTSTYTLKSMAGTLCGLSPLAADFNIEQENHFYQPCLPHIFEAFNHLNNSGAHADRPFTDESWKSAWLQSVTDTYDKQDRLMKVLGYEKEHQGMVDSAYLKDNPKFGKVNMSDINYYGMPEEAVEDYIRDAFVMAKENNQRLFLSHLTSTTHHPFKMPENETYVQLYNDSKDLKDLSRYTTACGSPSPTTAPPPPPLSPT